MSEWIRTDEQSPPLDVPVLVASGGRVTTHIAEMSNNGIGWKWSLFEGWADPRALYPHWMPLPPPPEPKLTVKEALREAVCLLDAARHSTMGRREIPLEGWFDWSSNIAIALPRLRSVLESEE